MVLRNNVKDAVYTISMTYFGDGNAEHWSTYSNVNQALNANQQEYDPHNFGNDNQPLNYCEAIFHLFKYIVGSGILALPFAFMNVGYLPGTLGTFVAGVLYLHIVHTLLAVEYELCKRLRVPNLTYVGVVKKSFENGPRRTRKLEPYFTFLVYFNYVINGAMGNASYLLIMGGNLKSIYDARYETNTNIEYFITVLIMPLIVLCWIPKLKFLFPFSMLTNVFNVINVIVILFYPTKAAAATTTTTTTATATTVVSWSNKLLGNMSYFPQFFGIVLGALSATGLVMPVKNDMEKPKEFGVATGVLNLSISIVTVVYALFGALGYHKYGDQTKGNVLTNLPQGEFLSTMVHSLYTIALCVSFTISFYIIFDTMWSNYLDKKTAYHKYSFLLKYGFKTAVNIFSYLMALGIPNFELFTSLTGSIGILTELCIPPMLQILILSTDGSSRLSKGATIVKNVAIIVIALAMFLSALFGSVWDIIKFYNR